MDAESLKVKGNEIYRTAEKNKKNLSDISYQEALKTAIQLYKQSLCQTLNLREESSLTKNIGVVSRRLALSLETEDPQKALYYYQLSVECVCRAIQRGVDKDENWKVLAVEILTQTIDDVTKFMKGKKEAGWLYKLEDICDKIPNELPEIKVCALVTIAKTAFNASVLLQEINYKESEVNLRICDRFCKNADKLIKSNKLQDPKEFNELTEDVKYHSFLLECINFIKKGDEQYHKALEDSDDFDMESVWMSIDYYKLAISLLKGKELEYEAVALSQLGRIYQRIIQNNEKAHVYFKASIDLALLKGIAHKECFSYASAALKTYQNIAVNNAEKEYKQKTEATRVKLEPILKSLEDAATGETLELLRYIATNHPPKTDTLPPIPLKVEKDKIKTLLLSICKHYHPDKQKDKPEEWKLISEEITKHLNNKLEELKAQ